MRIATNIKNIGSCIINLDNVSNIIKSSTGQAVVSFNSEEDDHYVLTEQYDDFISKLQAIGWIQ